MKLVNYKDVVDIVFDNYNEDLEDILDLLSALPKTDIVRCKDCKWYKFPTWADKYYCTFRCTWQDTDEDDFCSYGERREE